MSTTARSWAFTGITTDAAVVIVDDSPDNVMLLEHLLHSAGILHVRGFTDPRGALAHCAVALPDLVLLDLHMPQLGGFAFMEALQQMVPNGAFTPVLVLTADVTAEARERALAVGAKDFLTKPFDRTEVLLRVANLLETGTLYRHLQEHTAELQASLDEHTRATREAAAELDRRERRIRHALESDALSMIFQPVADLTTGEIVGAEALARFRCEPVRPPDEWFSEADSVGRGTELELAAIAAALDQIDQLPPSMFVALNASPSTAATPELEALLAGHQANRLVVELTEHTPIDDYDSLLQALTRLRRRGVRIAVDDTGAGYAGFQHLLRLRPDILKLDTTLTRGIDADPVRRALAAALVTFASDINATIIAEGIELTGELTALQNIGIRWGQGYHLARPGPLPLAAHRLACMSTHATDPVSPAR